MWPFLNIKLGSNISFGSMSIIFISFKKVNDLVLSVLEIQIWTGIHEYRTVHKEINSTVKFSFSLFDSWIIILTVFRKPSSAEPNSDHCCGEGVWSSQLPELHHHHFCSHQSRPRHQVNPLTCILPRWSTAGGDGERDGALQCTAVCGKFYC